MAGKGGILAFADSPDGGRVERKGKDEDDPRMEAAEALMSALKSGSATRFLDALDSVMDLRGEPELGPIEEMDEELN